MKKLAPELPKKQFRFRKLVLGFAIGVIFTLFIFYGIRTFYVEPDWNKMCSGRGPYAAPYPLKEPGAINQTQCDSVYGTIDQLSCEPQYRTTIYNSTLDCFAPICNECQMQYDTAREKYDSDIFIISIISGGLALIIGVALGVEAVGSGLMFGGVLTIFVGVVRNWGHLGNWFKFLILGVVLAGLIWIGYRRLKD